MNKIKAVFTDLDGTLLNDQEKLTQVNYNALIELEKNNILRILATGRNPYSLIKTVGEDLPVDYVIFSCGGGIYDWKKKELIVAKNFLKSHYEEIIRMLENERIDYSLHFQIPENHCFYFKKSGNLNTDFELRIQRYGSFAYPMNGFCEIEKSCEIIAYIPDDHYTFDYLESKFIDFDFLSIVRSTSPIDKKSIWMEFYPKNVNKGATAEWLCRFLSIEKELTLGIGNDYNDIDLLRFTNYKVLVENSPEKIKAMAHFVSASNNANGFAKAVNFFL